MVEAVPDDAHARPDRSSRITARLSARASAYPRSTVERVWSRAVELATSGKMESHATRLRHNPCAGFLAFDSNRKGPVFLGPSQ